MTKDVMINSKERTKKEKTSLTKHKENLQKNKENITSKSKEKNHKKSKKNKDSKLKISKENITYASLLIIDIFIIIYSAKKNYANYVSLAGSKNTYIGDNSLHLILGKNYITLIITAFFCIYICLLNKIILKKKNTKKFITILLLSLLIINCILFYAFTNKIY